MKKENIILAFAIIGVFLIVGDKAAGENQVQQEQLKQIERYISHQRHKVEDYYADKLAELELKRDAEIRLLEVADKGTFASLAAQARIAETVLGVEEKHKPKWSFEDTIGKSPRRFVATPSGIIEVKADIFAAIAEAKEDIFAAYDFAAIQSRIAEEKSDIVAAYETEIAKLAIQKRYALTVRLPELEERLKGNLFAEKHVSTPGLVSGIVYSEQKPAAIIGGKVVHQQEVVNGVRIVRICGDKVELEKKGEKWEQKVQEAPRTSWQ